ncbi:AAA family ATPase [Rhodobacter sphaeroides]|jgi:HNH endonuclease.|uniref:Putative HNH nuclease YajD n=1 Tax=Cereibacter sphaeroides (strain ATCC 17023 / DSM 158 / JCM 6121 / CCUG 31486 / LMG 2827 / NBRC 12203 / NCIMB 8253 / ATH 2.4.1.) TaxID=272943 RepID=Q3J4R1_CERS4|nr:AAA family ATPase [Cereibacter sphaeroides]ABA78223.1 Putative Phage-related Holin protein [Cereibacter sphaeroides 2.4.1]AMJ46586.1 HNH nuclease [Cereibacter sphaeroides]ANS33299.1 HNH nuclease [Cereibacter sphaeroides]ATN62342.1 HNH nuclease [Cereibacter sphaeroides]AXC60447.1 HNH nuclease [Cereibacter sphaeroides 2.4.1]
MARLRKIPQRLASAPARLASLSGGEGRSRTKARLTFSPWRAWYNTARWRALRWEILTEAAFTCRMCGRVEGNTSQLVADHKVPHRGDEALFWDRANLQCLCKSCHDSVKQSEERAQPQAASPAPMARPDWFRPVHVPLTIVVGPPGAGKSTWVRAAAGPDDLVICFEQITRRLLGIDRLNAEEGDRRIGDVLRERNAMLGDLMRTSARGRWPRAWLILTEPRADHRQWWADRLRPERIVVLATPEAECVRRCQADAAAGDRRKAGIAAVVARWWADYGPRPGEVVIAPPHPGVGAKSRG